MQCKIKNIKAMSKMKEKSTPMMNYEKGMNKFAI